MGMFDWVGSFAKDVLPTLVGVGTTLYGAKLASDAQDKSRATAANAQGKATAADLEGIRIAQQNQERMQQSASPGLMRVQSIIGRGEELTPEQLMALNDARRTTLDTLKGGSLRGSAAATAATINDVENRMRSSFTSQNRQQADNAATALSGQYFNSGNNISNLNKEAGNTVSQGLINTGQTNVTTDINNAAIKGGAIGDIGAVIADAMKERQNKARDSSYDPIVWNGPRQGAI